jgi:uncharacterized membrane protein
MQSSATYGVIDLGTFGGATSYAFAINDDGWVAGAAATAANAALLVLVRRCRELAQP